MAETNRPGLARSSDSGTYLGPGTKVHGRLLFEGATTIEGEVEGEILVHGTVTIGEQGNIKGKINATSAVIRGKVTGDIHAEKKIEIQPPGVVVGDLYMQSLVMGDGAILEGRCNMKKEKEAKILPLLRQDIANRKPEDLSG